jgi:hypothetical protein
MRRQQSSRDGEDAGGSGQKVEERRRKDVGDGQRKGMLAPAFEQHEVHKSTVHKRRRRQALMRFMIPLELNTAGAFGRAVAAHLNQLFPSPRRWPKISPKRFLAAATGTAAASPKVSASALIINPGISAAVSIVMVSEEHTFLCVGGSASSRLSLIVEPLLVTVVLNLHLVYFVFEFFHDCLVQETLAELILFVTSHFQLEFA